MTKTRKRQKVDACNIKTLQTKRKKTLTRESQKNAERNKETYRYPEAGRRKRQECGARRNNRKK